MSKKTQRLPAQLPPAEKPVSVRQPKPTPAQIRRAKSPSEVAQEIAAANQSEVDSFRIEQGILILLLKSGQKFYEPLTLDSE